VRNNQKRPSGIFIAAFTPLFLSAAAFGQGPKSALQDKLLVEYALTTPSVDNTDIVTAGSVLTLKKTGLTASAITAKIPTSNNFKDKDQVVAIMGRPVGTVNGR
jgi:hypothetical protein